MGHIVLVNAGNEAGFGLEYDPEKSGFLYRVFIHNSLPYREKSSWEFDSFAAARQFAATHFRQGWELLVWDGKVKRKCGSGEDGACGSDGGCGSGGGCGSKEGGCGTADPQSASASSGCSNCSIEAV